LRAPRRCLRSNMRHPNPRLSKIRAATWIAWTALVQIKTPKHTSSRLTDYSLVKEQPTKTAVISIRKLPGSAEQILPQTSLATFVTVVVTPNFRTASPAVGGAIILFRQPLSTSWTENFSVPRSWPSDPVKHRKGRHELANAQPVIDLPRPTA
jgi:hypothetical protein